MFDKSIPIPGKLSFGTFIDRPNRFLAHIIPDGKEEIEKAFLHDPGRMKELLKPNVQLLIREPLRSTERKTSWDILAVCHQNRWVTINSSLPNLVAKMALEHDWIPQLQGYSKIKPEISVGHSRFDFQLSDESGNCFVEVKGVTLVQDNRALFPDAPTSRGTRHVKELLALHKKGFRAVVLFICMRDDPTIFSTNAKTDYSFAQALLEAVQNGVEVLVYKVKPSIDNKQLQLLFGKQLPVELQYQM